MAVFEDLFTDSLSAVRVAVCALPTDTAAAASLSDETLLDAQRTLAEARRALDASAALIAGEIGHRSRPELGYGGLAQQQGFRTPEKLVQNATGSTAREAVTLVTVGAILHIAAADDSAADRSELRESWLVPVGRAVASGALSVNAAQAIRTGLGRPSEQIRTEALAQAVLSLLDEATALDADALLARARQLRDEIDLAGVAQREAQIHHERSVRRLRRPNGLSRYIIDPDLEAAAFLDDLYERITAPRRGNVSFLSHDDQAWAQTASGSSAKADASTSDTRTTDQYVHDALTDLLRIAVSADSAATARIIGSRQPAVRVLVTADALHSRTGLGRIEGIATPVSLATVERIACSNGTIAVTFDPDGNALDLGRERRLFTARQRIALAARDGGCRFPGCDRPPSWCEAHHIDHWHRDHGRTDPDRGILLCRYHHMLVHNNHWEIEHDTAGYRLIPPRAIDPTQKPRPMPTKSAALRDLLGPPRPPMGLSDGVSESSESRRASENCVSVDVPV